MRHAIGILLLMIAISSFTFAVERPKERDSHKDADNGQFLLSKGNAGKVRLGMSVDDLITTYGRERTKLVDLQAEGDFTPAIAIYLEGFKKRGYSYWDEYPIAATIAWEKGWIISMIHVHDPRFKTDKGIGVGSTLGELKKAYKVGNIVWVEGLHTHVAELGMTFFLDSDNLPEGFDQINGWNKLPDNEKVLGIAVLGQ